MSYYKHATAVVESDAIGDGSKIWHFVHIRDGASIGSNCVIGKSTYIDEDVIIGDRVKIQNFVSIYKGVRIDDDVFIGPSVTFTNDLYPRSFIWESEKITPTFVKKGASIGANSTVICSVSIGEYAMIGAGSVVTKSVSSFGLAYGNPAQLKGYVCYCGQKLYKAVEAESEHVFECDCGRTVTVRQQQ